MVTEKVGQSTYCVIPCHKSRFEQRQNKNTERLQTGIQFLALVSVPMYIQCYFHTTMHMTEYVLRPNNIQLIKISLYCIQTLDISHRKDIIHWKGKLKQFSFYHFILHTFNLLAIRSCPIFNIAQATKNILLKKPNLTSREVEWCTIHLNSSRVP